MLKILALPWHFFKYLTALALPMFAGAGASAADAANPAGRWAARLLLLAGFLILLGLLNQWELLNLSQVISGGSVISRFWLPLFAICLYAMTWLGWLLWKVLGVEIEAPTSDYPDIDDAWEQAVEALDRADIQLDETPLFFVLGWTGSSEEALFRSAGIKAQVKQVPRSPEAPLHVTAGRDAIWLTCPGTSLLGQVHSSVGGGGGDFAGDEMMTMSGGADDPFKTVGAGGGGETLRIEDFMAQIKKQGLLDQNPKPRRRGGLELEPSRSRLRHLCQLIARDRKGFCPINGVLILLPITAVDSPGDIEDIVAACRNDLSIAFDSYKLRCTILVLVTGLEKLAGFSDLLERLPQGQSGKRMGQRFPLNPDLKRAEIPARVESSVEWIGGILFPSMVHSMFQIETPGGEDVEDTMRTNANLYRFMMEIRDRQSRLGVLVKDCIPPAPDEPLLFGGCYFAGTGEDVATGQAFSPGVLKRLVEEQDNVTWTDRAVEQDSSSRRLARYIKVALIAYITLCTLASVGLIALKVLGGSEDV